MKEIVDTMHAVLLGISGLNGVDSVDETKISLTGVANSRLPIQRPQKYSWHWSIRRHV